MSLIANGLGGNGSNLILGTMKLSILEITIDGGDQPVRPMQYMDVSLDYYYITFKVKGKKKVWEKRYKINKYTGSVLIHFVKMINSMRRRTSIVLRNFKKRIKSIKVKLWKQ